MPFVLKCVILPNLELIRLCMFWYTKPRLLRRKVLRHMASIKGKTATLIDSKRKVLAFYVMRTGIFKQMPSLSRSIAALKDEVDSCIRDFIVVRDEDEIMVIVDVNQLRKDQQAFNELTRLIRLLLAKDEAAYEEVRYPSDSKYDPRRIYDDDNYGGFKVVRRRRIFRL